jgi:ATP-dependent RNA helicase RhlE
VNFDSFAFHPQINAGIKSAGYSTPTPIQVRTIPSIIEGRDVLGLAQTGTGKTAAFVLPILQRLMDGKRGKLRALIISPTRELAEQTHAAINALGRKTGLRSVTIYGGVGAQPQIRGIRSGAEIAVVCPGRLLDLMGQKLVSLNDIEVLVLDEADRMFDMGFLPAIRRIINALPAQRQTLLFSATMPPEVRVLTDKILRRPVTVEIDTSRPVESISHAVYGIDPSRKTDLLLEILYGAGSGQILIFTRTKHRAKKLSEQLAKAGFAATCLQGNLSQTRRQQAMDGFRSGRVQVMVATDIAARGIDVSEITHVINYDMPDTGDAYTHRIGRTGRMAQRGTALSLATHEDLPMIRTIENVLGRPLERRKAPGFESSAAVIEQANPRPFQANKPPAPSRGLSPNRRRSYSPPYSKR